MRPAWQPCAPFRDSKVLRIGAETFKRLLEHSPAANVTILQTVSQRLRQNEALLRQNEKMAALGTLAAGLAHELNNPSAAVSRSASQLRSALAEWNTAMGEIQQLSLTGEQSHTLDEFKKGMEARQSAHAALDPLTQSDRESGYRGGWTNAMWQMHGAWHRPWYQAVGNSARSQSWGRNSAALP